MVDLEWLATARQAGFGPDGWAGCDANGNARQAWLGRARLGRDSNGSAGVVRLIKVRPDRVRQARFGRAKYGAVRPS